MYIEPKITPIESVYDIRLVTLIDVLIEVLSDMSLLTNENPESILADALFKSTKKIHERGEEKTIEQVIRCYPILVEALN